MDYKHAFDFPVVSIDGASSFVCRCTTSSGTRDSREEWYFHAVPSTGYDGPDWYEVTVASLTAGDVQVVELHNHLPAEFHKRGIGVSLLPRIASYLNRSIVSSRKEVPGTGEFRSADADRVWHRLEDAKLAVFESEGDRFRLPLDRALAWVNTVTAYRAP